MIHSASHRTDLIGYLTFDCLARQATLVVCGRDGSPLREVSLVPVGALTGFLLRLGIRLGRYHSACRAIAHDDGDGRTFAVWISGRCRFIVSDESGERWLRSIDETTVTVQRAAVISRGETLRVTHRGLGDVSLN